MRERLPDYRILEQSEEEPIVLVGDPSALVGELPLRNAGDQMVVLRQATVRGEGVSGLEATATGARVHRLPDVIHPLPAVVLRPQQSRRVPLVVSIAPETPPGEYRGEIDVAGRAHPVVLHVTEVVDLRLSPSELVIENRPSDVVVKRVVFANKGNTPLEIGENFAVVLDDELLECRTLRAALAEWSKRPKDDKSVESFVVEVGNQAREVLERAGFLRVHNTAGKITLDPGQTRPVDFEIRVPPRLERQARYFGTLPLYTSNLDFRIVPIRGASEPEHADPGQASPPPITTSSSPVEGKAPAAKAPARKRAAKYVPSPPSPPRRSP